MHKPKQINRRHFLQGSLASMAALGFPAILPATALGARAARTAPGNRIVMGFVGMGGMGTSNLKGFLQKSEVQIVGVCDVDANHLQSAVQAVNQAYGNRDCAGYAHFEELIGRGDLDALVCATPDHWHALVEVAALRAGLDVYGEKPLSHDIREGRAVCDAVARYNRVWQTGSMQRSMRNFHQVAELVANGYLGQIVEVQVGLPGTNQRRNVTPADYLVSPVPPELDYDRWLGPARWVPYCKARVHNNWRWNENTGGGRLMDWIGHHFDIAQWALGVDRTGPVEIEGHGFYPHDPVNNAVENFLFQVRYAGGTAIRVGADRYFRQGVKFIGTEGWLYADRGVTEASDPRLLKIVIPASGQHLPRSDDHHGNFLECIRTRQECVAPAEAGHRAASAGYLGNVAMKLNRPVRWDPQAEQVVGDEEAARLIGRAYRAPWHL